jgi:hypothetical protein
MLHPKSWRYSYTCMPSLRSFSKNISGDILCVCDCNVTSHLMLSIVDYATLHHLVCRLSFGEAALNVFRMSGERWIYWAGPMDYDLCFSAAFRENFEHLRVIMDYVALGARWQMERPE